MLRPDPRPVNVNSNTSAYPVNVGGNYNANANYGLFYFNANNNASNTNANLGSRRLYDLYHLRTGRSLALAKNIAARDRFSRILERPVGKKENNAETKRSHL